jgi:hypothetical protein
MAGNAKAVSPIAACWTPLVPQRPGSGRSIRVLGGRGDQPGYDAAAVLKCLQGLYGNHWARFVGLPLPTSGHGESLSAPLLGLPVGLWGRRGHLVPVGFRYGRVSQTAWARKVPKGDTPTLGGHRAPGSAKVDWVAREPHRSDGVDQHSR